MRNQIQRKLTDIGLTIKDLLFYVSIRLGKTKIALDAIEPGDSVLWVYPSNAMVSGYQEDMIKFPPASDNIIFTNISSIKKFKNREFDFLIVDEPQRCKSKAQLAALKTIKYKKRFGLSGTMNKKTLTLLKEQLNWSIGATYTLEDGIRDQIVKDYRVFLHFVDLCDVNKTVEFKSYGKTILGTEKQAYENYCKTMTYFEEQEAEHRLNNNHAEATRCHWAFVKYMGLRTNLLYNSQCLLVGAERIIDQFRDRKALIYTLRTEVADKLSSRSFHTKNKLDETLEWFRNSTDGHMAAVDCVTTGITIKNLNTTIFHSYNSNSESFVQKLGRSLLYEHAGEAADVHVAVLRDTQNEVWVESMCTGLDINKIFYIKDGVTDTKLNWIIKDHPEKELYIVRDSFQVVYRNGETEDGKELYSYLKSPNKAYPFNRWKLKPVV